MQELVELDIPAVLLALLILGAVIAVVRVWILRSRKSSKAREEEFRRLQRLAAEEQARAEADWEEDYRRLKQSDVSRKNELRRRTTEGEGGVYWKKQHTAEFDDEAAAAPQQPRRAADVGSRIQAAAELEANLRKQQELEAAVNRKKQQEAELEEAVSRKKQELEALTREQAELESANRKKRAEEEEAARVKKQEELEAERRMQAEEEEEAKRKRKEKADREARLQQQQAELEAANQKEDPREEAKPGNQAEEQANHTKSVPELQQQQGEVLRKPPPEPKKKHMVGVGGGGRYFCAVCGKLTKRRCKQCKRVHYCSTECQLQHWIAGHKYECRGVDTGSPGSLDTDSRTFSEVPSPMSSRSENYKTFSDLTDMGSAVNELGASATAAPTSFRGPTHNSKLPSDGRQHSTGPKKILFPYDQFVELFNWDILNVPPCGLINCGNSCFANVVLQCLYYTQPLTAYFLEGCHGESCTRRDWCFMCELQKHEQKVRASQRPFAPINILSRIQKIGSHLGYGRQEDAHEFMRFAIDLMQTICLDTAGGEKAVDVSIQETSLIYRIFGGCLQSQVKCMQCLHESNRYEPMMDLAVEIQGNVKSLEDALGQFTSTELLDGVNKYECDHCNLFVNAHKRLTVYEAPNVLTVALKRFQGGKFGKLNKRVTFPEVLDMVPYMSGEGDKPPLYHLYAVVVHLDVSNASDSGHYICYIKNSLGHWYKIDDSKVKKVDLFEVTSQRAYMLFYARSSAWPPRVTGDGTAADGRLAGGQQSNESGRGTVRVERQRSSLYSLKSSPQPMELIRSIPDDAGSNGSGWYRVGTSSIQPNWSSDSGLDAQKKFVNRDSSVPLSSGDAEITENGIALAAQGGRSKANSSKVISISNNSSVGFQSLSGNLEHCLSFRLSSQPWDVTDVVNQPLWSPPRKGLGKLVKQRLFKGLSLGFFLKRFEKHNITALVSGSDSCAQQPCPAFTCPKVCVDSCHACSLLDKHNQMQSPEEPDNVLKGLWEKFFPEQTQHHLKDSSSSSVSGLVGPEFFQLFEESCSRHLEINNEAQKFQGGGIRMDLQNCMGVLSKVLPSGEVDFHCCSKSGFSHYFWTPGEQKNLNVFEDNNNAEVMTCGDFSLSSLARSSSIQGMFHPIQVR